MLSDGWEDEAEKKWREAAEAFGGWEWSAGLGIWDGNGRLDCARFCQRPCVEIMLVAVAERIFCSILQKKERELFAQKMEDFFLSLF